VIETHLRKLRNRAEIGPAEEMAIRGVFTAPRVVARRRTIIREGQMLEESIMLIDGWLARSKSLDTGERVLTEVHVPGDFADLHAFTLKRLDHDIVSLTDCTIAGAPHERLRRLFAEFPHLTHVYWLNTNVDAAIHRAMSISVGHCSAAERTAHLFCELFARLQIAGLTTGSSYDFPLTQDELGSCLGLTSVHVNRTLQTLRRRGLIHLENKRLTIIEPESLKALAKFDPSYLYAGGPNGNQRLSP
jgi:CRP-like cAMP-binding protein